MDDRGLESDNLQVKISLLRREERRWLALLADDSQTGTAHHHARTELHKVMSEILLTALRIKELEQ
jgi:hypothetical protein